MARKFVKLLPANTSALFFFLIKISPKYRYSLIQSSSALNTSSSASIMKKKITFPFQKPSCVSYVETNYIEQWFADAICLLWKIPTRICMSHSCRKIITSRDLQELIADCKAYMFVRFYGFFCFVLLFNDVVISDVRSVINKLHNRFPWKCRILDMIFLVICWWKEKIIVNALWYSCASQEGHARQWR